MTNEIIVETTTTQENVEVTPETTADVVEPKEPEQEEKETPEARKARLQGSFKRFAKDLDDLGIDPSTLLTAKAAPKSSKKSNDLDYGEKAFLMQTGVKVNELEFVQGLMKKTGLSLEEFATDDFAQAKLKGFRESNTTAQAVPSGTKRSSPQTKDSVDYHLEKYENGTMQLNDMPFEMRGKVLQAKLKKDENSSKFSFTPSI